MARLWSLDLQPQCGEGRRGDRALHWEEQKALAEGEGLTPGALVSSGQRVCKQGHALRIHLHRWRPRTRVTAGSRAIRGTRAGHFGGGLGHLPASVTRRDQRLGGLYDATEPWADSPVCFGPGRQQPHAGPWPALSQVVRLPQPSSRPSGPPWSYPGRAGIPPPGRWTHGQSGCPRDGPWAGLGPANCLSGGPGPPNPARQRCLRKGSGARRCRGWGGAGLGGGPLPLGDWVFPASSRAFEETPAAPAGRAS